MINEVAHPESLCKRERYLYRGNRVDYGVGYIVGRVVVKDCHVDEVDAWSIYVVDIPKLDAEVPQLACDWRRVRRMHWLWRVHK
jgi:hypothetical protein